MRMIRSDSARRCADSAIAPARRLAKRRKAKRRGLSGAGPREARDIGNVKIMAWHKPLSNEELIARVRGASSVRLQRDPSRRRRVLEHVLEIVHGIRRHLQ